MTSNLVNNLCYSKKLYSQSVYKENKGKAKDVSENTRFGTEVTEIYPNRKDINTIYGKTKINFQIDIYIDVYSDDKGYMVLNFTNLLNCERFKSFIIRTQLNNMTIEDLKELYDNIIEKAETEGSNQVYITIVKLLQAHKINKVLLKYEEVG